MSTRTAAGTLGLVALTALAGGCAWANRENRPVWNAFEQHLVPSNDAAFIATLPLTVPCGALAILCDTFVAHPLQVADDSWRDASELWIDLDWDEHYYSEMAGLPLRAVATPLAFAGAWLGRSLFDWEPNRTAEQEAALSERLERELIAWFGALARGDATARRDRAPDHWNAALERAFTQARDQAGPLGRYELYRYARTHRLAPWTSDPELGLRDPDPVVRFQVLEAWPPDHRTNRCRRRPARRSRPIRTRRFGNSPERRWVRTEFRRIGGDLGPPQAKAASTRRAALQHRTVEPAAGLEPATTALRKQSSTTELRWRRPCRGRRGT